MDTGLLPTPVFTTTEPVSIVETTTTTTATISSQSEWDKMMQDYINEITENAKKANGVVEDEDGTIHYMRKYEFSWINEYSKKPMDDIIYKLVETDSTGNEVIDELFTCNSSDESVKEYVLDVKIKPNEKRYFTIKVEQYPEGYISMLDDWKNDPDCMAFLPLFVIDRNAYDKMWQFAALRNNNMPSTHQRELTAYNSELRELELDYYQKYNIENAANNTGGLETYPVTTDGGTYDSNTTTTITANPVKELPEITLAGDSNEDGEVSIADAILIMQSLVNPDEYSLTPQGIANADINGDGITTLDALLIQEMLVKK